MRVSAGVIVIALSSVASAQEYGGYRQSESVDGAAADGCARHESDQVVNWADMLTPIKASLHQQHGGCGLDAWLGHASDSTNYSRQAVEPAGREGAPPNPASRHLSLHTLIDDGGCGVSGHVAVSALTESGWQRRPTRSLRPAVLDAHRSVRGAGSTPASRHLSLYTSTDGGCGVWETLSGATDGIALGRWQLGAGEESERRPISGSTPDSRHLSLHTSTDAGSADAPARNRNRFLEGRAQCRPLTIGNNDECEKRRPSAGGQPLSDGPPVGALHVSRNELRLPLGLQILRVASPVAHAMDYASTVQGITARRQAMSDLRGGAGGSRPPTPYQQAHLPGGWEQAPLMGGLAYRPGWFALYKAGVALATDRAVVGLYRAEDQRRRWWTLGVRPREWAWVLAGASVAVPAGASVANWSK